MIVKDEKERDGEHEDRKKTRGVGGLSSPRDSCVLAG